jgi:ubiquinone/menaquinone biosynthesis C-methylase UbiE
MTRWQRLYREDVRVSSSPRSECAQEAVEAFRRHQKRVILDLGCGAGRDAFFLAHTDLAVIGLDAARSGLEMAHQRAKAENTHLPLTEADARRIPFPDACFEGVYCFGLLHEFVGEGAAAAVEMVMREVHRVLQPAGVLILATLAGEPDQGLPHVRLFTEQMFDDAARLFQSIEKRVVEDTGCTGRSGYKTWRGLFTKPA